MVHIHSLSIRNLDGILDLYFIHKHIIDAERRCIMIFHPIAHLVGGIAGARSVLTHVVLLRRGVVWCLALIEVHTSVLSVPEGLIFLEVLVEKAIHCHVIAVHYQSVGCSNDKVLENCKV